MHVLGTLLCCVSCSTLHHTAAHFSTLHYEKLRHTASFCCVLHHTASHQIKLHHTDKVHVGMHLKLTHWHIYTYIHLFHACVRPSRVLQCAAVLMQGGYSVGAVPRSVMQCGAVCYNVLQCVAMCCSVL